MVPTPTALTPGSARSLAAWIDRRLKAYGQDPRLLTGDAFLAWHAEQMAESASDSERRGMLTLMQAAWQAT